MTTSPEAVRGFASLFAGHTGAWFDGDRNQCIWGRVTLETFRRHLAGHQSIGTYPVRPDDTCRWGCIDIDTDDFELAFKIYKAWEWCGIRSWIEVSRSKGWHVWVLTNEWIPATVMRGAGLWIAYLCNIEGIEVNPKNDSTKKTKTGLVNTVRLPYAGNANPGRMRIVDPENPSEIYSLQTFVARAMAEPADPVRLLGLSAKRQREREGRGSTGPSGRFDLSGNVARQANGLGLSAHQKAAAIVRGTSVARVGERDNQLYTIANYLKSKGWGWEEARYRMTKVYNEQLEDNVSYDLEDALEKVDRVYGY